jgi:hypothetical protein
MKFTPRADSPIVAEMLRQDFVPDYSEASREIHLDQEATETDKAIALATAAAGIGCMAGVLGLAGLSAPIIIPVFALAGGALHAWNSMATVRNRELELQFLRDHPDVLEAAAAKMDNSNEDAYKIGNAYEGAFRAYRMGDKPVLSEVKERSVVEPTSTPLPTASTWEATASSAPPAAMPSAVQPPMQSPAISPSDRAALIARLKEDCPLMLKLVKSHPIRAVGAQRTGKTTLVKKLCLLRMLLLSGHGVVAATPHYEPRNPYPKVFRVAGVDMSGNRDYPAIEAQWDDMAAKVEGCLTSNQTYVWDEFGLFDKVMPTPEGKDAPPCKIKTVLTSCLRETMKFGIYPIFIVHGETAAFLPGSKGLVTVFIGSTVRVETIGEAVEGDDGLETIQPTGKFNVTWLDGTKAEGQIPGWMTEQYLLSLLGNVKPPSAPLPTTPGPAPRRGKLRVPTQSRMPEAWETIGQAMAVTAGLVTTERPGTINSDGVKLPMTTAADYETLKILFHSLEASHYLTAGEKYAAKRNARDLQGQQGGQAAIEMLSNLLEDSRDGAGPLRPSAQPKVEEVEADPEYKVWAWAWEKLGRFPNGLPLHRLWSDAPIGIKNLGDRDIFTTRIQTAIDVGLILSDGDGKLLANPEMEP